MGAACGKLLDLDAHVLAVVDIHHRLPLARRLAALEEAAELLVHREVLRAEVDVDALDARRADAVQGVEVECIGLQHLLIVVVENGDRGRLVHVDEPGLVEEFGIVAALQVQVVIQAVLLEVLAWNRFAIIVALYLLAADFPQEIALLLCLRAFSQRVDREVLGHADEVLEDLAAFRGEGMQELHIKLYRIEVVVLQGIERGVAAAEVVEQHGIAFFLELLDPVQYRVHSADQRVFRNLDLDEAERQAVFFADRLGDGERVLEQEVKA